jgi:hypothetical protein
LLTRDEAQRIAANIAKLPKLQFETTLRQRDVIGEWEPIPSNAERSGIILRNRRWVRGLTWADISDQLTITKDTTKTGAVVSHDLTLCPLVTEVLSHISAELPTFSSTISGPTLSAAKAKPWFCDNNQMLFDKSEEFFDNQMKIKCGI